MDRKRVMVGVGALAGLLLIVGGFVWQSMDLQQAQKQDQQDVLAGAGENMPNDLGQWTSTFVWPKDRLHDRDAVNLSLRFRHPDLRRLLKQTNVQEIYVDDNPESSWNRVYKNWFDGSTTQFWLLRPDPDNPGGPALPVYKVSGKGIPSSGEKLAGEISVMVRRCRPNKPAVTPPPTQPGPNTQVSVQIPDIRPDPEQPAEEEPDFPWWLVIVAAGSLAIGVAIAWKRGL